MTEISQEKSSSTRNRVERVKGNVKEDQQLGREKGKRKTKKTPKPVTPQMIVQGRSGKVGGSGSSFPSAQSSPNPGAENSKAAGSSGWP